MEIDSEITIGEALLAFASATVACSFLALKVMINGQDEWAEMHSDMVMPGTPEQIMALLDPTSPTNRWVLRGDGFSCVDEASNTYRVIAKPAPEHPVLVSVLDRHGDTMISVATHFERNDHDIKIIGSADTYRLTKLEDGQTQVALQMVVKFKPDLDPLTYAFHSGLFRASGPQDLKQLRRESEAVH